MLTRYDIQCPTVSMYTSLIAHGGKKEQAKKGGKTKDKERVLINMIIMTLFNICIFSLRARRELVR